VDDRASGPELKQRLAAILAADAAGYSRLMAANDGATVAALDAARAVFRGHIERNRGRVVDMAGDSVLATFETAAGAVSAALAVQRQLEEAAGLLPQERRMRFRIGVHLGDIIEKGDGTVYGDGVNIASRLQGLADPGGIVISESVRQAVRSRVAAAFEDLGKQEVKNIPQPVHVYRISHGAARVERAKAAGAVLEKPSIAVLPFANMSGDPEQEYFSDGLTEDIITALAAWRSFPVIARNSTFAYKGKSPDVRQVAKELGARYVLEGSVRKAGNRVRITGQLVDGSTGSHLWAERYDRELHDLFAVQDEITTRIVAAIEPEMSGAEIRQVEKRPPSSFTAWDFYVRGLANMPSYGKHRAETKRLFEQALAEDPAFVEACTALAMCHSADIYASRSEDVEVSIAAMVALADQALAIDPRHFRIYVVRCMVDFWRGEMGKAVDAGRQAVALNPSSAEAYEGLSAALCHLGIAKEAEEAARACLRLTPVDPRLHRFHFLLAQALLGQHRFGEAHHELMKALGARPHDIVLLGYRTVLLGHLGRTQEARACLEEYLAKRGLKTADDYRKLYVRNSALTELNLDGLRKAGWKA
jgi:adenylate cyclase